MWTKTMRLIHASTEPYGGVERQRRRRDVATWLDWTDARHGGDHRRRSAAPGARGARDARPPRDASGVDAMGVGGDPGELPDDRSAASCAHLGASRRRDRVDLGRAGGRADGDRGRQGIFPYSPSPVFAYFLPSPVILQLLTQEVP
jgi:hypothetical protein